MFNKPTFDQAIDMFRDTLTRGAQHIDKELAAQISHLQIALGARDQRMADIDRREDELTAQYDAAMEKLAAERDAAVAEFENDLAGHVEMLTVIRKNIGVGATLPATAADAPDGLPAPPRGKPKVIPGGKGRSVDSEKDAG